MDGARKLCWRGARGSTTLATMRTLTLLVLLAACDASNAPTRAADTAASDANLADAAPVDLDIGPGRSGGPRLGDMAAGDTPGANSDGPSPTETDAGPRIDPTLPTSDDVGAPGPHPVGWHTVELVDATRPTPPNGDFPGAATRTLVTDVYYPSATPGADAPLTGGAWPLVVYSHGYMSTRTENMDLLKHLASYGMVVAAPTFPLSSQGAPGGPTIADIGSQPRDVSFVIDALMELSGEPGWAQGAVTSTSQVAAVGLSLGGLTTGLLLFAPDLQDPRIGAFAILGGPLCFVPPAWLPAALPPTLLVYGDGDAIIPYEANGRAPFEAMAGPRALVTLAGGTHVGFASAAATLFDAIPDPDGIGCSALGTNLEGQSFGSLAERAGFGDRRPDIDSCPAPCASPPPVPKLGTKAQAALLPLTVGAFLRGHFASDPTLTRYLFERLPHDHPEAAVEGNL